MLNLAPPPKAGAKLAETTRAPADQDANIKNAMEVSLHGWENGVQGGRLTALVPLTESRHQHKCLGEKNEEKNDRGGQDASSVSIPHRIEEQSAKYQNEND